VLKAAIERLEEINPRLNAVNYKARATGACEHYVGVCSFSEAAVTE
jgi:hypothetical protein